MPESVYIDIRKTKGNPIMTKFSNFDKKNLNNLRNDLNAILEKYGMSSNLEIEVGNMRFSSAEVEIKVTAKVKGAKTMSDSILESRCAALGLKMKNKAGDVLVGYNTRAHKMPFVYVSATDGKRYKCSTEIVKLHFSA